MKKRIIVTGANGFAGGHLVGELKSRGGIEVIGVDYLPDTEHRALDVYFGADLVESWPEIETADAVIHLAGLAAVAPSFDHPQKYINFNSAMLTNLCEYYLKTEKRPRIVVISSGSVYSGDQKMPLTEGSRPGFSSPYVVSKITNENQVKYYKTRGLDIVTVRPFNHIGPNQGAGFILPDLYKKIVSAENNTISVGNLSTRRDYTDVRDIVRAYADIALAEKSVHDLYNVCSGKAVSGREIFDLLKVELGRMEMETEEDPKLFRPNDAKEVFGDYSLMKEEYGWQPRISLLQTVQDFVKSSR